MRELNQPELEGLIKFNKGAVALFFYTPFCGTCKMASKMLEITLEAIPEAIMYKCNVNRVPDIIQQWEISSVPCIVLLQGAKVEQKIYAMQSVADLYTLLKSNTPEKRES
ncbi:thioredoxin family protein [Caldalkalibacillus mannanilyticus]|uniref:thioredoxin family protein n=1 Tax=Caldalkalibacillus mannanilyticus TaxID=1418 RepID=UPI0004689BF6|nr:thioredoxin family protein [Caldalkalibacillus mannanilyticus]